MDFILHYTYTGAATQCYYWKFHLLHWNTCVRVDQKTTQANSWFGDLFARQASFMVLSKVSKHFVQSSQGLISNSKGRNW